MDFVNRTGVRAGWTMGFDRDGRELVVVIVKATFIMPLDDQAPQLAEEQVPLTDSDRFSGEPGYSAPVHEVDYAHRKPMCDVLLNGTAYAPRGTAVTRLSVSLQVGAMVKTFAVVGDRVWRKSILGPRASEPQRFDAMPISYDNAFGGVDASRADSGTMKTFAENPVGRGYSYFHDDIDERPLPNTEEPDRPVSDPRGPYRPMAFGPIGRNWLPRVGYAGTYDDGWLEHKAPFWPDDFDDRYFQAAAPDQQIPHVRGQEEVVLRNLTPDGFLAFRLPTLAMPVWFIPHRGKDIRLDAQVDTIVLEPDEGRFTLSCRAALPMRRSCFDMKQIIAGEMPVAWQRARKAGTKPYYNGLAELVRARRGR
jgi:hypothetical protein